MEPAVPMPAGTAARLRTLWQLPPARPEGDALTANPVFKADGDLRKQVGYFAMTPAVFRQVAMPSAADSAASSQKTALGVNSPIGPTGSVNRKIRFLGTA